MTEANASALASLVIGDALEKGEYSEPQKLSSASFIQYVLIESQWAKHIKDCLPEELPNLQSPASKKEENDHKASSEASQPEVVSAPSHQEADKKEPIVISPSFSSQLHEKAKGYLIRSVSLEKDGALDKAKLYMSLYTILNEENTHYKSHGSKETCLKSISDKILDIETTSKINDGRSIFAQIKRWIESFLSTNDSDKEIKSVKVSEMKHLFSNPSTKTVEDLAEVAEISRLTSILL